MSPAKCVALLLLGVVACAPKPVEPFPLPAGVRFAQNPNLLPGGEFAVVAGAPGQPGPYAFRVRFPAGFKVMPHTHPEDRIYTVLTGTWTIGIGTEYDAAALQRFRPGAVYVLKAGTPHFHGAPDGPAMFQVSGVGPTATVYLKAEDDPRRH